VPNNLKGDFTAKLSWNVKPFDIVCKETKFSID